MSLFLPLAILSLPAIAAPISGWAYPSIIPASDIGIPSLRGLATVPKTSLVSSASWTDSISLAGTGLDTDLSSVLQDLALTHPALDSYLGSWVSSDELADYLGVGTAIPATCLVVRAGEDPEAWVSIPDGETSSETVANLESSSWVLLDDLACDLTETTFVAIQSIFVYQLDGTSDTAVYVSLTDSESTLSTLPLDRTLDTFLYTDITGVSSDLDLGNGSGGTMPPSENLISDSHLDAPTPVWSETDHLASDDDLWTDDLWIDSNLAADSESDLLTSTSSSLDSDTDLAGNPLNSSFDVDVASNPSDLNSLGVSPCP